MVFERSYWNKYQDMDSEDYWLIAIWMFEKYNSIAAVKESWFSVKLVTCVGNWNKKVKN